MVRKWVSERLVWLGSFILKTAFKISDESVQATNETDSESNADTDEFPRVLSSVVLTPEAIEMRADRTRVKKSVITSAPLDGSIESRVRREW